MVCHELSLESCTHGFLKVSGGNEAGRKMHMKSKIKAVRGKPIMFRMIVLMIKLGKELHVHLTLFKDTEVRGDQHPSRKKLFVLTAHILGQSKTSLTTPNINSNC